MTLGRDGPPWAEVSRWGTEVGQGWELGVGGEVHGVGADVLCELMGELWLMGDHSLLGLFILWGHWQFVIMNYFNKSGIILNTRTIRKYIQFVIFITSLTSC